MTSPLPVDQVWVNIRVRRLSVLLLIPCRQTRNDTKRQAYGFLQVTDDSMRAMARSDLSNIVVTSCSSSTRM